MRRALALAERGWGRVSPNPLVGAVVVQGEEIVGEGWHPEYGRPHAEPEALRQAGDRARGATVYVTLEPCSHFGKTPPCSEALLEAGIARLIFAAPDPNPVAGGGAARLAAAGVEVLGGVEEQAARDLNGAFFHRFNPDGKRRPWVELKLALSLDARVADAGGRSFWITGEEARTEVHRLRAAHDAIAVGIGTVLADDPLLTVRGAVEPRVAPVRVVFDGDLRLPLASRLAATARELPVWVVARSGAPAEARAALERAGVRVLFADDVEQALAALRSEGLLSVFCEGGARLASALIDAGAVDRLSLFYAPLLLGPLGGSPFAGVTSPALQDAVRWRHLRTSTFGDDTFLSLAR